MGPFFNYFDNFLPIIDHLPTPGWNRRRNFFTVTRENLHTADISSTTYDLPRLVNVVKKKTFMCVGGGVTEVERNYSAI